MKERELHHRDQIDVGASVFLFLLEDTDTPSDDTLALAKLNYARTEGGWRD